MSLESGRKLGPYEIVAPIGRGGMGEVYKARDTRLDRTVAIKVLPAELSENEERRQRFEREARAVSSLSHPNICTLYDFGREDGVDFMAMEYIEGDTLAERLDKGALTVDEALSHGTAIANALQKAHRHGVVHRDLKPGNIIITKTGAKLLDFGLATRLRQSGEASVDVSAMTEAKPLTQEGTILGTFQYMAPEQLEGKDADARTDLFALGAVLYEMLTGQRAFQGKTQASLITAIMSAEPPAPSTLLPVTPRRLDEVLARCLAKDPDERWQSAGDLSWELGRVTEAEVPERRARSSKLPWIVAAIAAVAAVALGVKWQQTLSQPKPLIKSSLLAPAGAIDAHYIFALSPDGRHVAFEMKDAAGRDVLAVRSLDALEPRVLEGTVGAHYPFWSPDSSTIGFFVGGRLKKIPLEGGPTRTVCEITAARVVSGTWNEDGVILLGSSTGPIFRVPASGGTPTAVTVLDRDDRRRSRRWAHELRRGRRAVPGRTQAL